MNIGTAPRQFTTGAQVLDNVKRTRNYFNSLRSPTFELEQQIVGLTKKLEGAAKEKESLEATISDLRRRLFLYEDPAKTGRVSIKSIQQIVAYHYGISITEICSARRTAPVVFPRQIAMYLAKVLTTGSYPEIGRSFGGRDHTTVLHACRTVTAKFETNPELRSIVNFLRDRLLQESTSRHEAGIAPDQQGAPPGVF